MGVLGAILPALATDAAWNLTPMQLGALGSYTLIGMLIGGLSVGTLSDLYGRKPLFIACLALFAACMVTNAWAPRPGGSRSAASSPAAASAASSPSRPR